MDYSNHKAEDFACDAYFKKWVLLNDPEAALFWKKWMVKHPEKELMIKEAKYIVKALSIPENVFDGKREKKLLQKINQSSYTDIKPEWKRAQREKLIPEYAFVVTAFIIFGAFTFLFVSRSSWLNPGNGTELVQTEEWINYETKRGEKLPLKLPDGSSVKLNAESSISYSKSFGTNNRKLKLTGEAFFDVVNNDSLPFVVKTSTISTRVLGTTFNISAYPEDPNHHVYLVSGKVEVDLPVGDIAVSLTKGEQLVLQPDTQKHTKVKPHNANGILWTEGILIFEQATLQEVFLDLERWYGVDILSGSSVNLKERVSGKFQDETLINVLQSICFYVNYDFEIRKDKIFIN